MNCKVCGETLRKDEKNSILVCDNCGKKYRLKTPTEKIKEAPIENIPFEGAKKRTISVHTAADRRQKKSSSGSKTRQTTMKEYQEAERKEVASGSAAFILSFAIGIAMLFVPAIGWIGVLFIVLGMAGVLVDAKKDSSTLLITISLMVALCAIIVSLVLHNTILPLLSQIQYF